MSNKQKVKTKRLLSLLLVLTMVLGMIPAMSMTAFAYTGSGTEADPYVVTTYDELRELMRNTTETRYIKLGGDVISNDIQNLYVLLVNGGNIILDLAGYTLKRTSLVTSDKNMIEVIQGSLTIKDSGIGGTGQVISCLGETNDDLMFSSRTNLIEVDGAYAQLTIEGGTFTNEINFGEALVIGQGTTTVNGGTFIVPYHGHGGGIPRPWSVVDNSLDSEIFINGGTFYNGIYFEDDSNLHITNCTVTGGDSTIWIEKGKLGNCISESTSVLVNGVIRPRADLYFLTHGKEIVITTPKLVLTGRVQFTSAANVGKPISIALLDGTVNDLTSSDLQYQWQINNSGTWENVTVSNPTEKNYVPTADQVGKELRIVITADSYEGSIVSDAVTVTKVFNPFSPAYAPYMTAVADAEGNYTIMRVSVKAGQDYVWRDSQEADLSKIDWTVNSFKKPADKDYVDITDLTAGNTYYVYTRLSETDEIKAGAGVKYSSLIMKDKKYLQKVLLEGYTDYGDGNTIYIPVGEEITINVSPYPTEATSWSYFTFGDPGYGTCYTVTDSAKVNDTMPKSITLKGNSVGSGTLKAYYNGGMYSYGSWRVRVYDPNDSATYDISFTSTPAYENITLTVGDSFTPVAPTSGLMLPTQANDEFEYKWYVYEACASYGSPYGMVTENGYISIDPDNGTVTALSAELDENKGNLYQPYAVLYAVNKNNSSIYKPVTSYKVTVSGKGEIPIESITVVPSEVTMAPGASMAPTAIINPTNHTATGTIIWSKVSGSDSITIDPATGKVTVSDTAADGDAATFRAAFGDKTADFTVTVDVPTEPTDPTAPTEKYILGDVDMDGKVKINDATMIQKHLASIITLSQLQKKAADVTADGNVNIKDATKIQKFLAGLLTEL
ncbi:MAG: dockerin type I repeat-containing protein [Acutalibacteraceae bacterium]